MGNVEENRRHWNEVYSWETEGEEWSESWGSSHAQWLGCILPRIQAFLPTGTVLEIAPGFGRWSRFLKDRCERLVLVDLAERCIEGCKARFARESHISYHVNDGQSLAMIEDRSIDFAFTFGSLVHAEAGVLAAYVRELAAKLTPDGVAFIHHSNIGEYVDYFERVERLGPLRGPLARLGLVEATGHGRSRTMTAARFLEFARDAGLSCVSQELINSNTKPARLIDCISVVAPFGSRFERPYRLVRNGAFMREAACIAALAPFVRDSSALYGRDEAPAPQPQASHQGGA